MNTKTTLMSYIGFRVLEIMAKNMETTIALADVDARLLTSGVRTNSWSIGKPVYGFEDADEIPCIGIVRGTSGRLGNDIGTDFNPCIPQSL